MTDHLVEPLPTIEVSAEQLRLILEPTRGAIIDVLTEGPATVSELAEAFRRPKSTIAHHCSRLEAAGLIFVQRTRKVRAIEEKFYARTAQTFLLTTATKHADIARNPLVDAAQEKEAASQELPNSDDLPSVSTFRHLRIPEERAQEWVERLIDLATEFVQQEPGGTTSYGLAVGLFPTTRPVISRDTDTGGQE